MWYMKVFLAVIGFCGGGVVASALAAFMISLGIIPRYAGITHTGDRLLLYENCTILGTVLGNLYSIYHWSAPGGTIGLALTGIFFGIFLGSWIIALGEVVNIFAIMARRVNLKKGIGLVVLSIAVGKIIGSLLFFYYGW